MKNFSIPSTKFLTAIIFAICLTFVEYWLIKSGNYDYTELYFGLMTGIGVSQGIFKTIQNVVLAKANGNGNGGVKP